MRIVPFVLVVALLGSCSEPPPVAAARTGPDAATREAPARPAPVDAGGADGAAQGALRRIRESLSGARSTGSEDLAAWTAASRGLTDATARLGGEDRAALAADVGERLADPDASYAVLRRCVVVLRELGELETLCDLATDPRRDPRLAAQAAEAVVATGPDAASIVALLPSGHPGVLVVALRWVAEHGGQGVAHDRLIALCGSDDAPVRAAAVRAVARDADPGRSAANAAAIAASIRDARAAFRDTSAATLPGLTAHDEFLRSVSRSLGEFRGDRDALLAAVADIGGEVGVFVAAGRARLGDPDVHEVLASAVVDATSPAARWCAAEGLGAIGTADDLDLLDRVARDDPFRVATHRGDAFPVRDAGARAATEIRARPVER